jgi:hypothetical protein
MSEETWQEIRLKKAILNSVIMLLKAMEFSEEESAIEHDITIAIKSLEFAVAAIQKRSKWAGWMSEEQIKDFLQPARTPSLLDGSLNLLAGKFNLPGSKTTNTSCYKITYHEGTKEECSPTLDMLIDAYAPIATVGEVEYWQRK